MLKRTFISVVFLAMVGTSLSAQTDTLILNQETINLYNNYKTVKVRDSLLNILNTYSGKYCKIYSKGKLQEEGIWNYEFFDGSYKSYYKNGKVKMSGTYDKGCKVGDWLYYKHNGKLKKKVHYEKSPCVF